MISFDAMFLDFNTRIAPEERVLLFVILLSLKDLKISNCICDGSVAILEVKDSKYSVTKEDLAYYATEEFSEFYKIARNRGTRSLNIDNNSVFFFGLLKK